MFSVFKKTSNVERSPSPLLLHSKPSMHPPVLKVKGLSKVQPLDLTSPSQKILDDLSLEVEEASLTALVGRNGSGKSTLFSCLLHLCPFDRGSISFFDQATWNRQVKNRIGFVPERATFPPHINAMYFLYLHWQLRGLGSRKHFLHKAIDLLKDLNLFSYKEKPLKSFSKGMRQRLSIAQSLLHEADLFLWDEPFSGLDREGRDYLKRLILKLHQQGKTLFFSTHQIHELEPICTHILQLEGGQIKKEAVSSQVIAKKDFSQFVFLLIYQKKGQTRTEKVPSFELQERLAKLYKEGNKIKGIYPEEEMR